VIVVSGSVTDFKLSQVFDWPYMTAAQAAITNVAKRIRSMNLPPPSLSAVRIRL
jgi:hypothetical protein